MDHEQDDFNYYEFVEPIEDVDLDEHKDALKEMSDYEEE